MHFVNFWRIYAAPAGAMQHHRRVVARATAAAGGASSRVDASTTSSTNYDWIYVINTLRMTINIMTHPVRYSSTSKYLNTTAGWLGWLGGGRPF